MYFLLGLCLKRTRPRVLKQNLQTKWFDKGQRSTSYPSKRHYYKRGKSRMITTDNMHQGYIFWVWSDVHFCCCLLYFVYLLEGEGLYFIAAAALCVHVKGVRGWGGANLKSVKRIVTLHWNKTNVIDNIYIYITIHLKKVNIQMNLKIPCNSCSD